MLKDFGIRRTCRIVVLAGKLIRTYTELHAVHADAFMRAHDVSKQRKQQQVSAFTAGHSDVRHSSSELPNEQSIFKVYVLISMLL